jgi:hypothetical protein
MLGKYIPAKLFRKWRAERVIRRKFEATFGYALPAIPVRFSEKLAHRMIELSRNGAGIETRMADKLAVRDFVRERVGERYLTPVLWSGRHAEEIPFDDLPSRYVIKTNHGCASVAIVRGSPDRERIVTQFRNWLGKNFYWAALEEQYYRIEPRVYVEEFVDVGSGEPPLDYRFFCFHGTPAIIQVDNHDHSINSFYDAEWNKLDLYYREGAERPDTARPANLAEMLEVASSLAAGFDFVRVDLYSDGSQVRFGEMTFTPTAGTMKLKPEGWDDRLGALM